MRTSRPPARVKDEEIPAAASRSTAQPETMEAAEKPKHELDRGDIASFSDSS